MDKFARLEACLGPGPYFDGERFSLVDVVFGPIFRYFDAFDLVGDFRILASKPKIAAYRQALATRPSVRAAVATDYNARLWRFLQAPNSHLSRIIAQHENETGGNGHDAVAPVAGVLQYNEGYRATPVAGSS
jgi:glutathione S-transferase